MFFYNESDSETSQIGGGSTDEHFDNVSLLLPMDSDFSDSSDYNHSVTVSGNTVISSTESKFGGASAYFDGTGDYLAINDLSAFDFGANEFTVECWINKTGFGPNTQWGDATIITTADPTDGLGFGLMDRGGSFGILLSDTSITNTAWKENIDTGVSIPQNQWSHVALVRNGDVFTLYVNGVSEWSATFSHTLRNTDGGLRIGGRAVWNQFFTGYIDDVRITKGVARYTANFTPPTEAHPTQGESAPAGATDPSFANVELLLPMDSDFNDVSSNSYVPTVNGAAISTADSKFGGASGYFNGTNTVVAPDMGLGTQDFTMEAWIKRGGTDSSKFYLFSIGGTAAGSYGFYIQDGHIENVIYGMAPGTFRSPNVDVSANVWTHIATVRQSGVLYTYVNGTLVQTVQNAGTSIAAANLNIGGALWNQYNDFVGGYIDDVRITVGEARYTANFTPPSEAHPTS